MILLTPLTIILPLAETTKKKKTKYSYKHFSDYLSNENSCTIFLQPTDKEEIANIISLLNSNKASGLNSIPYRILFLLKNEILKQLADLFNLSFMTSVFPSVHKTAKVVPVFKKDSKLDCSNYCPTSLLSNIEKILENLCIRDYIPKLFYKTNRYGKYSITVSAVELWSKIQKHLKGMLLKHLSPRKIKTIVSNFYLRSY